MGGESILRKVVPIAIVFKDRITLSSALSTPPSRPCDLMIRGEEVEGVAWMMEERR